MSSQYSPLKYMFGAILSQWRQVKINPRCGYNVGPEVRQLGLNSNPTPKQLCDPRRVHFSAPVSPYVNGTHLRGCNEIKR